jgi:hypothetical protein
MKRIIVKRFGMLIIWLLLGFVIGFGVCFMRGKPYFFIRKQVDSVKSQFGLFPVRSAAKPTMFLLGDSLVKRGNWLFLESDYSPVNLGRGGARVIDIKEYLESQPEVKNGHVLLLLGINNLADRQPMEDLVKDYEDLVDECLKRNLSTTIISLPLVSGGNEYDRSAAVKLVNAELRRISEEKACGYFDMNLVLSDRLGLLHGYTSDDLHLTEAAYNKMGLYLIENQNND